jgi:hypothetical protein
MRFENFKKKYPQLISGDCVSLHLFAQEMIMTRELVKMKVVNQSVLDDLMSDFNCLADKSHHRDKLLNELLK